MSKSTMISFLKWGTLLIGVMCAQELTTSWSAGFFTGLAVCLVHDIYEALKK